MHEDWNHSRAVIPNTDIVAVCLGVQYWGRGRAAFAFLNSSPCDSDAPRSGRTGLLKDQHWRNLITLLKGLTLLFGLHET